MELRFLSQNDTIGLENAVYLFMTTDGLQSLLSMVYDEKESNK